MKKLLMLVIAASAIGFAFAQEPQGEKKCDMKQGNMSHCMQQAEKKSCCMKEEGCCAKHEESKGCCAKHEGEKSHGMHHKGDHKPADK